MVIEFVRLLDVVQNLDEQVLEPQQCADTFVEGIVVAGHGIFFTG